MPKLLLPALLVLAVLAGCRAGSGSSDLPVQPGPPQPPPPIAATCPDTAQALRVTDAGQLVGGSEVARGQVGDFLLQNDRIRTVIRRGGRQWHGTVNPYGGTIVDADICRGEGERERSNFENSAFGINVETIPHYTNVTILNDGANGEPAIIRATGKLDLFAYANPSSVIRDMGFEFPNSADDRPLPVEVQTDYILEAGKHYVLQETTVFNQSGEDLDIFLAEYLSGSGFVDAFIPGTGFGEPLATTACPISKWVACDSGLCDPCNFIAFSGYDSGSDVAYGIIHPFFGSSTMNVTGINVPLYGVEALTVVLGLGQPNFTVPAGGQLVLPRWFAVTGGSVSNIQKVRNEIFGFQTGTISGTVTSGGQPVAGAQVAVIRENLDLELFAIDNPDALALIAGLTDPDTISGLLQDLLLGGGLSRLLGGSGLVDTAVAVLAPEWDAVSQDVTDAEGRFHFELPPGSYQLRTYKEDRLQASPALAEVNLTAGATAQRNFTLPGPGFLQVTVRDEAGNLMPAKVQLVGNHPNPPLANRQSILGQVETRTGLFFDQFTRDPLPDGIAFVDFVGVNGQLPPSEVTPGTYSIAISRGHRYSLFTLDDVTITEGEVTVIDAQLTRLMETPGFVSADFHVHGVDSLDARISREDRVLTYLAEGLDFFTPSDHGFQIDFQPTIQALNASQWIGSAPSAEATTMDYGHFNAWPRSIQADKLSGGYMDWGWGDEVEPGRRFPEFGNYLQPPAGIIAQGKSDPFTFPIVQINHVDSFFGPGGVGLDSSQNPPQSTVDPLSRRLNPSLGNLFSDSFDALEIWIGVNNRLGITDRLMENMAHWFNMLNQGIVRTAVASSDTHTRRLTSMSTRSLVASSVTDPGQLSAHAQALADTVAEGRVVLTNAPFVRIQIENTGGQRAGLMLDEPTQISAVGGEVEVLIDITSPHWAPFDRVELYVNNAPQRLDDPNDAEDAPSFTACPDIVLHAGEDFVINTVPVGDASRLQATISQPLLLSEDAWIVARVAGSDGISSPLFPVEPNDIAAGGILAHAITNPLFVDIDGDGVWNPPGVRLGDCGAPPSGGSGGLPIPLPIGLPLL